MKFRPPVEVRRRSLDPCPLDVPGPGAYNPRSAYAPPHVPAPRLGPHNRQLKGVETSTDPVSSIPLLPWDGADRPVRGATALAAVAALCGRATAQRCMLNDEEEAEQAAAAAAAAARRAGEASNVGTEATFVAESGRRVSARPGVGFGSRVPRFFDAERAEDETNLELLRTKLAEEGEEGEERKDLEQDEDNEQCVFYEAGGEPEEEEEEGSTARLQLGFGAVERRVPGGSWGRSTRFDWQRAAPIAPGRGQATPAAPTEERLAAWLAMQQGQLTSASAPFGSTTPRIEPPQPPSPHSSASSLSDAPTERGPMQPPPAFVSSRHPRGPAALILPEGRKTQMARMTQAEKAALAARLGPGAYGRAPSEEVMDRRSANAGSWRLPQPAAACRRRRGRPFPASGKRLHQPVEPKPQAPSPWARAPPRERPVKKAPPSGRTRPSSGGGGPALGRGVPWEVLKPRAPAAQFGSVPRRLERGSQPQPCTPLRNISHATVERRPVGGFIPPTPSTAPRTPLDERGLRLRAAFIDALLRGDTSLTPAAPADAVRRRVTGGFSYVGAIVQRIPSRRSPAGPPPPPLEPLHTLIEPRPPTAYLGPGAAVRAPAARPSLENAAHAFPGPGSYDATASFLLLCVPRPPTQAVLFAPTESTRALARRRREAARLVEGDMLRLDVLAPLVHTRLSTPSVVRWLLPTTVPRPTTNPRPFATAPPPPLQLLPPPRVPTPLLGPMRYGPREASERMPPWGFMLRPSTFGVDCPSLGPASWSLVEPRVRGGAWGATERFAAIHELAEALPEGDVLTLLPSEALMRPRHGSLVCMASGTPRFTDESGWLLEGDVLALRVERRLVEPAGIAVGFRGGRARDDVRTHEEWLLGEGILLLQPARALVEPRADRSLVSMNEGAAAARRRRRDERRARRRQLAAPVHGGSILRDIEAAILAHRSSSLKR